MTKDLQSMLRNKNLRAHLDAGEFVKPLTLEQLAQIGKTLLDPKSFEAGDTVVISKKPFGVRFAVGTVGVVISQNVNDIPVASNDGTPLSCAALGDTLVAFPDITDTGFIVFQIHSSVLEIAHEVDVVAADARHAAAFEELMAETNPTKSEEN